MLFDRMRMPYGSKKPCGALLVVNGAGGVGSIMIQPAARLTGLTVIATASRPETTEWVRKLGASHVADHSRPLDEAIKAIGFNGRRLCRGDHYNARECSRHRRSAQAAGAHQVHR
jgi:NADPH:quinone reductase-like Zn-dependent oxidoreductase